MSLDLPSPSPKELDLLTPTRANDLLACPTRVAWQLDERFRKLQRPTPASALGTIAHAVVEDIGHGLLHGLDPDDARPKVERSWSDHEARVCEALRAAWSPARPPPPPEWPGYQLTKARILRRSTRTTEAADPGHDEGRAVTIERDLTDTEIGLTGRPDRVEQSQHGARVVDLKTSIAQEGPTGPQRRQLLMYADLVRATSGAWPEKMAIEDASGRRWEEPVDRAEAENLIGQLLTARARFADARAADKLLELAQPADDTCRWCAHRVICGPYWTAINSTWRHGSVLGTVTTSTGGPTPSTQLTVERPTDLAGQPCTITAAPRSWERGVDIAVTDAGRTASDSHLRWRWSTVSWPMP